MEIREVSSYQELKQCVGLTRDTYKDPLFPPDEKYFFKNILRLWQSGASVKVVLKDKLIVSWGCIVISAPYLHSREVEASQMYYQTLLEGISAVKSLRMYHAEIIKFARKHKVSKCTTSSIMDSQETFYRILEKDGWKRRGCFMVYNLDIEREDKCWVTPTATKGQGVRVAPRSGAATSQAVVKPQ